MRLSTPFAFLAVVSSVAAFRSRGAEPWCLPRGGSDGSYENQLDSVKTSVLQSASESVSSNRTK